MSAPKDWIETSTKLVPKPVYKALIGIPFYANDNGMVYREDGDKFFVKNVSYTKDGDDNTPSYDIKFRFDNTPKDGKYQ
jgi:hypothetical protein